MSPSVIKGASLSGHLVGGVGTVLRKRSQFTTVIWLEEKEAWSGRDSRWHQGSIGAYIGKDLAGHVKPFAAEEKTLKVLK